MSNHNDDSILVVRDSIAIIILIVGMLAIGEVILKKRTNAPIKNPIPVYLGKENMIQRNKTRISSSSTIIYFTE